MDGPDRENIERNVEECELLMFIIGWYENLLAYVELFEVALLLPR